MTAVPTHIAGEVSIAFLLILAALAAASLVSLGLQRLRPHHDYRELRSRVRTWWAIVAMFTLAVLLSPLCGVVFLALVSFLALKEFLSVAPTRRDDRRVLFYAYAAIPLQFYLAGIQSYGMFIILIPVLLFVWIPTRMVMIGQTRGFMRSAGTLHWAVMLTVFSLSHAAYLLVLQPADTPRSIGQYTSQVGRAHPGPGLLLFLVLMTELNDILQYLWGKSLGVRRVAPQVSPGKTYAGLIGGVASTVVIATLIGPYLTLLDWQRSLLAGTLIGIAGFAGDLCLSALKRDIGIKDFGTSLPGHGGVLDRIDSLLFTAPLFFHFVYHIYG